MNLIDLGGGTNRITHDLISGPLISSGISINMATWHHSAGIRRHGQVHQRPGSRRQPGDDTIIGSSGNDLISGISTTSGIERIYAGAGNDTIYGYDMVNWFWRPWPVVQIWGEDGNDFIAGTNAANLLDGGSGDDTIYGNDGNDTIRGGEGNDRLDGGAGIDTVDLDGTAEGVFLEPGFDRPGGPVYLYGVDTLGSGSRTRGAVSVTTR